MPKDQGGGGGRLAETPEEKKKRLAREARARRAK